MRALKWLLGGVVAVVVAGTGFVYAMPEQAARLAIHAERQRAGLVRKEIDLPGGLHSVYLEGGRGEPLILLHGFGANKDNFLRVARQLTPHYRVIVPDLTGFGESSHPAGADYMPAAQAERVRALAQALGLRRLHLGGSSMGGQIAMSYAVLHPDDLIVSVCDTVNEELGDLPNPHVHWSIPDPARVDTDAAFTAALSDISARVEHLAPRVRYRRHTTRSTT